ncbi:MAG: FIMAH domain-containing protein [Planctomycetota bacterium]|jgi:hypothetical protein
MQYPKTVAFAATLSVALPSCSDFHLPTEPLATTRAALSVSTLGAEEFSCAGGEWLLLLQDNVPWEAGADQHPLGANVTELLAQGVSFCMAGSNAVTALDLTQFSTVALSAAQPQAFYENLFPAGSVDPSLTAYVDGGGVLVANLADVGSGPAGGRWAGNTFVGGTRVYTWFQNTNSIAASDHPIIAGPSECPSGNCGVIQDDGVRQDLDNWLFSSHGYFTDLPAGTTVLLTQPIGSGQPEPIMVQYPVGQGTVIASMVTAERRYSWRFIRNLELLANELAHAVSISTPVEEPLTASERIAALTADLDMLVATGVLTYGNVRSLESKLMAAAKSLEAGRLRTAANQVHAFMLEVEALIRSGRLTEEQGAPLMDAASALLAALDEI